MESRRLTWGFAGAVLLACLGAGFSSAAVFDPPSTTSLTNLISGTAPSGIAWDTVSTGTSLPVRTTTSGFDGIPGAVLFFNTDTGQLQLNPNGLNVSSVIITYTSGTTNPTGTTPGPFVYPTGSGTTAYSPASGTPKTFPASAEPISSFGPTTIPARVGLTVGSPFATALLTSGDAGNIASTNGWFNAPWSFPLDIVGSVDVPLSAVVISDFKTIGQSSNANANILGYGSQQAVFQYGITGVSGNQVGAVVPVTAVPEPATLVLVGASIAGVGFSLRRGFLRQRAVEQA